MFFKINMCIFIGVRMKAFTIQSKKKIGAWAHMRPPLSNLKRRIVLSMYRKQKRLSDVQSLHFVFA